MSGCATLPPGAHTVGAPLLDEVPFWPQQRYQCGPAALATVLEYSQVDMTPAALVDAVYLPERQGSLQPEMLAAARRNGRLPLPVTTQPTALAEVLQGGYPVLVLQNLGVRWLPVWHYAVVIGMPDGEDSVVLRSGHDAQRRMSRKRFWASLERAGNWAYVVARPSVIPLFIDAATWLDAAVAMEEAGAADAARRAYAAAADRWPDQSRAWQYLGTARFSAGDGFGAVDALQRAQHLSPLDPVIANNLAYALGQLGCADQALAVIDAVIETPEAMSWRAALRATRAASQGLHAGECPLAPQ